MLLAVTDVSRYTRLTEAIFSALISCIFIFGAHMKAYSGYRRGEMQIQVRWRPLTKGRRRLGRGKTFTLDVAASDSVASVKAQIHEKEGIPPEEQCLVFRGKLLEDERTLQDYCVFKDAELELLGRVPGGVNPAAGAGLNAARGTSTVTAPEGAPPANRPQRRGSGPEMPAAAEGGVPTLVDR